VNKYKRWGQRSNYHLFYSVHRSIYLHIAA
jgi:hypothetical protein